MTYLYSTEKGDVTIARQCPMGKAPRKVRAPDGRWAYRDHTAEKAPSYAPKLRGAVDPVKGSTSIAMAVLPRQAKEAEAAAFKMGIPTKFNKRGEPVWDGTSHRKRFNEAHRTYDLNGGYGDPQRK